VEGAGFFKDQKDLFEIPLAPAVPVGSGTGRLWNRFGGIIEEVARRLEVDAATCAAVLLVESGGRFFGPDGRLIIRFENHRFWKYWGKTHPDGFHRHFRFGSKKRWEGHAFRGEGDRRWRRFHGRQDGEWSAFGLARSFDEGAAMLSISMGAPQILGENHVRIGYASVGEMFEAFSDSERSQVLGLFDFLAAGSRDGPMVKALRKGDFLAFARLYNGTGRAAAYARSIRRANRAFGPD